MDFLLPTACKPGFWGEECDSRCACKNGASCDHETGECDCPDGWRGRKCDKRK